VTEDTVTIDLETATPAAIRRFLRPVPETRTVTRRSPDGADLGDVELDPDLFGIEPNQAVLHQVVTAQLAAARAGTQSTKTRAQVRGGGAKPFAQKGTGRARQGSSRSPSMSGGGVALGPKPRSYRQHTPKKMVRLALLSALSDRAAHNRVALVDEWGWEGPKTKDAVAALGNLKITGTVLVVLADDETTARRSFANLPDAQTTSFGQLSAHDVLRSDWILFSDRTLPGAGVPGAGGPGAGGPGAGGPVPEATVGTTTEDETESGEATTDA
jgi:large subunit ribosomal protein L4